MPRARGASAIPGAKERVGCVLGLEEVLCCLKIGRGDNVCRAARGTHIEGAADLAEGH